MSFVFELQRFAYHYVDPRQPGPACSQAETDLAQLPLPIRFLLLEMAEQIWDSPDAGSTRSARFAVNVSEAHPLIETIRREEGEDEFFEASRQLAVLLHQRSHPKASPGLLGVMRLKNTEDGRVFAALVKIQHHDEEFVRVQAGELPQLEIAQVRAILRSEIQKGALIPHPAKEEYDVKVIDAQSREDPAAYFTEKFLGCVSKRSDDLQVRKVVPALERFAEQQEVPIAVEKLPQVIRDLQEQPANITPPVLAQVVAQGELFGEEFQPQKLVAFLEEQRLGDLDIPVEGFQQKRRRVRRIIYRFVDPQYDGLEISGPPEAFQKVLNNEGEEVTFVVRTSSEGFKFNYQ